MIEKEFKTEAGEWAHSLWGFQSVPKDFDTTTKKYPILLFFHGRGLRGGLQPDLSKTRNEGPTPYMSTIGEQFIYVAIQSNNDWSPDVNLVMYAVQNDPQLKGRIAEIYLTGFSAGASSVINYIIASTSNAKLIKAVVPISSPDVNRSLFKNALGVNLWIFGTDDGYASFSMADDFAKTINGRHTPLPKDHDSYPIYNPSYKENWNGKQLNIYEWMLTFAGTQIETPPTNPTYVLNEGEIVLAGVKYKLTKV